MNGPIDRPAGPPGRAHDRSGAFLLGMVPPTAAMIRATDSPELPSLGVWPRASRRSARRPTRPRPIAPPPRSGLALRPHRVASRPPDMVGRPALRPRRTGMDEVDWSPPRGGCRPIDGSRADARRRLLGPARLPPPLRGRDDGAAPFEPLLGGIRRPIAFAWSPAVGEGRPASVSAPLDRLVQADDEDRPRWRRGRGRDRLRPLAR